MWITVVQFALEPWHQARCLPCRNRFLNIEWMGICLIGLSCRLSEIIHIFSTMRNIKWAFSSDGYKAVAHPALLLTQKETALERERLPARSQLSERGWAGAGTGATGHTRWIPGSRRSPGERNGNPLQYACLENSMDRGAWWATVRGVTKSQSWLSSLAHMHRGNKDAVRQNEQFSVFIT